MSEIMKRYSFYNGSEKDTISVDGKSQSCSEYKYLLLQHPRASGNVPQMPLIYSVKEGPYYFIGKHYFTNLKKIELKPLGDEALKKAFGTRVDRVDFSANITANDGSQQSL